MSNPREIGLEILKRLRDSRAPNQRNNLLLAGHYCGIKEFLYNNKDLEKIDPEDREYVIEQIVDKYKNSLVKPGETVGVQSSQAQGEVFSQDTLNTHRKAGISSARETLSGLSQFEDLVELKDKNAISVIFLKNKRTSYDAISAIKLIENVLLGDLVEYKEVIETNNAQSDNNMIDLFLDLLTISYNINGRNTIRNNLEVDPAKTSKVLRLHMNKTELYSRKLSMEKIAFLIEEKDVNRKTRVLYTDISTGILDIYYDEKSIRDIAQNVPSKVSREQKEIASYYNNVLYPTIQDSKVAGVKGIKNVYPSYISVSDAFKDYIETQEEDSMVFRFDRNKLERYAIDDDHIRDYVIYRIVIAGGDKSVSITPIKSEENQYCSQLSMYKMYRVSNIGLMYDQNSKKGIKKAMNRGKYMELSELSVIEEIPDSNDIKIIPRIFDMPEGLRSIITIQEIAKGLISAYGGKNVEIINNNILLKGPKSKGKEKKEKVLRRDHASTIKLTSDFLEDISEKWFLEGKGTNLEQLLSMNIVDSRTTYSTSTKEIYNVLGIKASRNYISNTLIDSSRVFYHHLTLLADTLTYQGFPIPATRIGSAKQDFGFIAKFANEETTTQIFRAATFGMSEDINSLSSKIFVGSPGNFGSSFDESVEIEQVETRTTFMREQRKKRKPLARTLVSGKEKSRFKSRREVRKIIIKKDLPNVL